MAFVMIATGATSRSRVRTLSVRPLIAPPGVAALALLASGGALGYWLAEFAAARWCRRWPRPSRSALPFTLEQVGAISARLFRLESEAAQLSKRIGVMNADVPARARTGRRDETPARPSRPAPTGGPLLAPHADRPTARSARSTRSSAGSSSRSPRSRAPPPSSRSR